MFESKNYVTDEYVTDENGKEVSPLDDDYRYYKSIWEDFNNPLSDDYCKYDD